MSLQLTLSQDGRRAASPLNIACPGLVDTQRFFESILDFESFLVLQRVYPPTARFADAPRWAFHCVSEKTLDESSEKVYLFCRYRQETT
jgi:hypothetical protein